MLCATTSTFAGVRFFEKVVWAFHDILRQLDRGDGFGPWDLATLFPCFSDSFFGDLHDELIALPFGTFRELWARALSPYVFIEAAASYETNHMRQALDVKP